MTTNHQRAELDAIRKGVAEFEADLARFQAAAKVLVSRLNVDKPEGNAMEAYQGGNPTLKAMTVSYHRLMLAARKLDTLAETKGRQAVMSKVEAKRQDDKKADRKAELRAAREDGAATETPIAEATSDDGGDP